MRGQVYTVNRDDLDRRFFIDCPVRTVMEGDKLVKMEIPQGLAEYMQDLQTQNERLRLDLKKAREPYNMFTTGGTK